MRRVFVCSVPQLFGIKPRVGESGDCRGNLFAVLFIGHAVPFIVCGEHRYFGISVTDAFVGDLGKEKLGL